MTYLRVNAKCASEGFPILCRNGHILAWTDLGNLAREVDRETLMPTEVEWICILANLEAERDDPHPHQVTPVDALEALSDHCLDALFQNTTQLAD